MAGNKPTHTADDIFKEMSQCAPEKIEAMDQRYILRAWTPVGEPVLIERGQGPYVWDVFGKKYIDCNSGLFSNNAGFSNPKILDAVTKQVSKIIQTSMRQSNVPAIFLAAKLAQITPGDLDQIYYTTSGAECTENAIKMARSYSNKSEMIVLKNAYHGLSYGALAATSSSKYKKGFGPMLPGFLRAPMPYCYRCHFQQETCNLWCANEIEAIIKGDGIETTSECNEIGAAMIEPVQGSGGIIPPEGYLTRVQEICRDHGLVFVLDEIQTGFGRTGKMFAAEHEGLTPDILLMAKNVGGGFPLGAVVTTKPYAKNFITGTCTTLAGNAVACAAGLALISELRERKLAENAAEIGAYLKDGFENLDNRRFIGEAYFQGLMGGCEIVKDKKTKEPISGPEKESLVWRLLDEGIMLSASGPLGNRFRVHPTLDITRKDADQILAAFDKAIHEVLAP
jgi:4-aminobutyrate aminotransferase/(S)-3-amino-2-methylpropionate transaminase